MNRRATTVFVIHTFIAVTSALYLHPKQEIPSDILPLKNPTNQKTDIAEATMNNPSRKGNPRRMLTIDVSQLTPRASKLSTEPNTSTPKLLGIDISVLSQNPDPSLPVSTPDFYISKNSKVILQDTFDPRYDRLPNITPYDFEPVPNTRPKFGRALAYPFNHWPINVMAFHSMVQNKPNKSLGEYSRDEDEKRFTADFIFHLLHHLSKQKTYGGR